jgi:hypothetical protein
MAGRQSFATFSDLVEGGRGAAHKAGFLSQEGGSQVMDH